MLLEFLERLRTRSVEHTNVAEELKPVVVIAIRPPVITQIVFRTAGVGRTIV